MKLFFLNFGHSATPVDVPDGVEVRRVDHTIHMTNPTDPEELLGVAETLARELGPALREAITDGFVPVVGLPGASSLSAAILAAVHGLTGFFPWAVTGVRQAEGGFLYPLGRALKLDDVRVKARALRRELGF